MSVIVVVRGAGRVCMACDSQASFGGSILTRAHDQPKIVKAGPCLFGTDGHIIAGNYFRYHLPEVPPQDGDLCDWIERTLVPHYWAHLKDRARLEIHDGQASNPSHLLVARRDEFVFVDGTGSTLKLATPWWATGSGGDAARGAIWALWPRPVPGGPYTALSDSDAERIAVRAVQAAIATDDGCGGPVVVEWTDT